MSRGRRALTAAMVATIGASAVMSPREARAEHDPPVYAESGMIDVRHGRRTVVVARPRERLSVSVVAGGFAPRVVVTRRGSSRIVAAGAARVGFVAPDAGEYVVAIEAPGARAGTYDLTVASDLLVAPLSAPSASHVAVGGAFGVDGTGAAATVELAAGPLLAVARGEVGRADDDAPRFDLTALVGLGPRISGRVQPPSVERDAVCFDADCWSRGSRVRFRPPRPAAARPFALLAGARARAGAPTDRFRTSVVVAARWYHGRADRARFARDFVELSVSHVVAGRDRPYLRHASFMPGWSLVAQKDVGIVLGAEVGISGLAYRDADARLVPELDARLYALFPLEL